MLWDPARTADAKEKVPVGAWREALPQLSQGVAQAAFPVLGSQLVPQTWPC